MQYSQWAMATIAAVAAVAVGTAVQMGAPVAAIALAVATSGAAWASYWFAVQLGGVQQSLKDIAASVSAVATTSQVVATRSNAEGWRQCLQFAAQWHRVSVQGAYKLSCRKPLAL